jgi:hemerythrin
MVPVHGVASFLANWLENHILRWDMEFFDFIRDYPIDEP